MSLLSLLTVFLANQTTTQLQTYLWNAIDLGYPYPVAILLYTGVNPNILYNGRTYLEFAGEKWAKEVGTQSITRMINYENKWFDIIQILLYYRANPCLRNNDWISPYNHIYNVYNLQKISRINSIKNTPIYKIFSRCYNKSSIDHQLNDQYLECSRNKLKRKCR